MLPRCSSSSVQFSSRIRFVTDGEFSRLPMMANSSTKLRGGTLDVFEKDCHTKGILMCNAGGVVLVSPQKVALFHFLGDDAGFPRNEVQQLTTQVNAMRGDNTRLRAFIIGGESQYPFSIGLRNQLKAFFRNAGIPFSIFWGHNSFQGESGIAYSASEDTWYVNTRYADNPDNIWSHGEVQSLPELKSAFEEISLDHGDEVVIDGKKYQAKDVNTPFNLHRYRLFHWLGFQH